MSESQLPLIWLNEHWVVVSFRSSPITIITYLQLQSDYLSRVVSFRSSPINLPLAPICSFNPNIQIGWFLLGPQSHYIRAKLTLGCSFLVGFHHAPQVPILQKKTLPVSNYEMQTLDVCELCQVLCDASEASLRAPVQAEHYKCPVCIYKLDFSGGRRILHLS